MDADLNDPAWGELGELFSKDCSPSSAIDAFQVQLNGDLVVPADLPLPTVSLPEHNVRLDAALNPVQVSDEGEPVSPVTAMDVDAQPKQEELVSPPAEPSQPVAEPTTAKPEPTPAAVTSAAPAATTPPPAAAPTPAAPAAPAAPVSPARSATKQEPTPAPAPAPAPAPTAAASAALARPAEGRVEKRSIGSLKEKREREARQFPRSLLSNLDGTTSAEVRKMSAKERELVLYKRKLRNRESARRSRQKRQATLAELQEEIGDLLQIAERMVDSGLALRAENGALREKLDLAQAEIRALRAVYPSATATAPAAPASALATEQGAESGAEEAAVVAAAVTPEPPAPVAAVKVGAAGGKGSRDEDMSIKMKMGG